MRGHVVTLLVILGIIALGALTVWLLGALTDIPAFDSRAPELVFYIALLLLFAAGAVHAPRLGLRETVRNILVWAAVFVVLVIGYSYRDELTAVWQRVSGELSPGVTTVEGRAISVRAGSGGHFYLDTKLNGAAVTMLVDTGATSTVLSQTHARAAGLDPATLSYIIPLVTANGRILAAPARIRTFEIGPRVFNDVRVLVTRRAGDGTSVLGIETLRLFRSYEVSGNSLTLRW